MWPSFSRTLRSRAEIGRSAIFTARAAEGMSRIADFQSAERERPGAFGVCRLEALRYSRLETCATFQRAAGPGVFFNLGVQVRTWVRRVWHPLDGGNPKRTNQRWLCWLWTYSPPLTSIGVLNC